LIGSPLQIIELSPFPRDQKARGGLVEAGTLQLANRAREFGDLRAQS
jgi:hypothetical protein